MRSWAGAGASRPGEGARKEWTEAVKLNPENEDAAAGLARIKTLWGK